MNTAWPRRHEWIALGVGVLGLGGCLLLGLAAPRQALASFLSAFLYFTGLAVGSLALAMVHSLTGGAWGYFIRPQLLAAARTLPLMAVLAIPILAGVHALYPWAHADAMAQDALLRRQSWYLNPAFFVLRSIAYFALWLAFLALFLRGVRDNARLPRIAAPGLIVFALTTLLASTDWIASLLPHWHSTIFGMLVATGWMLAAAALAVLAAPAAAEAGSPAAPRLLQDLGNLLLMFVLGWSYLAFMQYLTVWIADLPAENVWYIPRTLTSWRWLAWFLIAFHFLVPFATLLFLRAKRSRAWLRSIAGMLLVAGLAEAWWLVLPNLHPGGFALRWTDLCAPLGIGGVWACMYLGQLRALHRATDAGFRRMDGRHG